MADYAVPSPTERTRLDADAVLRQAWRLYRRLFWRSVLLGGVIFGVLHLVELLAERNGRNAGIELLSFVLLVGGTAFLQGGLVEIVRGLHVDGDDDPSLPEVAGRAGGRTPLLVRVSLLSALGVGVGTLLFLVPGLVLMARWAVAVPVAMLEGGTARGALRRSRAIVAGNGWNVFLVLFAVGVLSALVSIPFLLVSAHLGPFGWWATVTLASMLTAPYAAHALTVVYYRLTEPDRPVALEPGRRWSSVWDEEEQSPSVGG